MAGTIQQYDIGILDRSVEVHFQKMTTALKTSLKTALEAIGKGGAVTVILDTGDDLTITGLTAGGGGHTFYLEDYRAEYIMNGFWHVVVTLRYIT